MLRQLSKAAFSLLLAATLCGPKAQAGLQLTGPEAVTGQWDFSGHDGNRKCRVTLRMEPANGGSFVLAMPAGCRKAFPILANVSAWSLPDESHLNLADPSGTPVLDFASEPGESGRSLYANGPEGETYELIAITAAVARSQTLPPLGLTEPTPAPRQTAALTPRVETPATRAADIPGRYAVLRDGHDTGCMVTLDRTKAGDRAMLAPACRDQGIVVFDPVAWEIVRGRLVLTARKGHSTHLDSQPDGTWLKDPREGGKSLALKRL